jgi:hypothetical protein
VWLSKGNSVWGAKTKLKSAELCADKRRAVGHSTFLPLLALLSAAPQQPIHNQNRSSVTQIYGRHGTSLRNDYALVRHCLISTSR